MEDRRVLRTGREWRKVEDRGRWREKPGGGKRKGEVEGKERMEDRVEQGKWRMEDRWREKGGGFKMEDGGQVHEGEGWRTCVG